MYYCAAAGRLIVCDGLQGVLKLVGWDSVVSIASWSMGWMVQGLNLDGGEIFCTSPDLCWGSPCLLYIVYWVSFLGSSCQGVTLTTHPM
jgi:hypothetical protein